jgi:FixJ family two-component response regulator
METSWVSTMMTNHSGWHSSSHPNRLGTARAGLPLRRNLLPGTGKDHATVSFSDIHMPGMSGFNLKRLLASRDSKVPFIMTTARAEQDLEAKAIAAGAVCFLRKPFQSSDLIACLERVLSAP